MTRLLAVIVFTALTLSGVGVRAGGILENLGQLLVLKERADRAQAQQETAEWAAKGRAMVLLNDCAEEGVRQQQIAEWASEGQYMILLDTRADRAEAQQDKAEWMRQGMGMMMWPDLVEVLAERPANQESILWITPVGLLYRSGMESANRGDPQALETLRQANELAARAEARREAIRAKNEKLN